MNDLEQQPRILCPQKTSPRTPAFEYECGIVVALAPDGWLEVEVGGRPRVRCEWLHAAGAHAPAASDQVLLLIRTDESTSGIVLGRVGPVVNGTASADSRAQVQIEATERLTLICGQSSIDLRADGKVVIRGEDVLVRAKGTKRIRAGTVSIN